MTKYNTLNASRIMISSGAGGDWFKENNNVHSLNLEQKGKQRVSLYLIVNKPLPTLPYKRGVGVL